MKRFLLNIISILICLGVLCVIICLIVTYLNTTAGKSSFDIVEILSLLVAVLIGWNIFSVVNINNMAEDIVREREIIQSERANLTNEIRKTLTEEYALMATSYENEIKKGKIEYAEPFIFFAVLLLLQLDKINDIKRMEDICDKILNYEKCFNSITLEHNTKIMICRNISLIKSNDEKFIKVRDLVFDLK